TATTRSRSTTTAPAAPKTSLRLRVIFDNETLLAARSGRSRAARDRAGGMETRATQVSDGTPGRVPAEGARPAARTGRCISSRGCAGQYVAGRPPSTSGPGEGVATRLLGCEGSVKAAVRSRGRSPKTAPLRRVSGRSLPAQGVVSMKTWILASTFLAL